MFMSERQDLCQLEHGTDFGKNLEEIDFIVAEPVSEKWIGIALMA
jgi:hypothetical protein